MPVKKVNPDIIADKASDLFIKRGYSNTSMADIGQSCNILKGSIYHHFASKEKLLLYVLKRLKNELCDHVFTIADNVELQELQRLEKINALLKEYFLDKKACLVAIVAMENELISERAVRITHEIFKAWKDSYVKLFKKYFSQSLAEMHATNAIIYIEGAIIWLRITREDEPLKRAFSTIEKQFLLGQAGQA